MLSWLDNFWSKITPTTQQFVACFFAFSCEFSPSFFLNFKCKRLVSSTGDHRFCASCEWQFIAFIRAILYGSSVGLNLFFYLKKTLFIQHWLSTAFVLSALRLSLLLWEKITHIYSQSTVRNTKRRISRCTVNFDWSRV